MNRQRVRASRLPATCLVLSLAFLPSRAPADDGAHWEILGGRSVTLHSQWADALFVERLGEARALGPIAWMPDVGIGWIDSRSTRAARLDHDVALLALGARVPIWRGIFVGEQLGITHGKTDALSSTGEFVSTLGWQGGRWVALVRHISNADLHTPNHGETMLLAGFAF